MKSVMRWLSRDRLPAYVGSFHKVNLWARQPSEGRLAVAMVNSSFDPAVEPDLVLLTCIKQLRVFDMRGRETVVSAGRADGPYQHFTLPTIEPWSMRIIASAP
jgi:hypothetical protein